MATSLRNFFARPFAKIFLMWTGWVVIVIAFQAVASARLTPIFPDKVLPWTEQGTGAKYQQGHIYLNEPFLNGQVAWDSEYYLSIAVKGYDDIFVCRQMRTSWPEFWKNFRYYG